jgi:hypothetical protein
VKGVRLRELRRRRKSRGCEGQRGAFGAPVCRQPHPAAKPLRPSAAVPAVHAAPAPATVLQTVADRCVHGHPRIRDADWRCKLLQSNVVWPGRAATAPATVLQSAADRCILPHALMRWPPARRNPLQADASAFRSCVCTRKRSLQLLFIPHSAFRISSDLSKSPSQANSSRFNSIRSSDHQPNQGPRVANRRIRAESASKP